MLTLLLATVVLVVGLVGARLWFPPELPSFGLGEEIALAPRPSTTVTRPTPQARQAQPPSDPKAGDAHSAPLPPDSSTGWTPEVDVSFATWSQRGWASAQTNLQHIGVLMPLWYELANPDGEVRLESSARRALLESHLEANKPTESIMPVVSGNPPLLARVLASSSSRRTMAAQIADVAAAKGHSGVCVDFSGLPPSSYGDALLLLSELRLKSSERALKTCVVVPLADSAWPLEQIAALVDRVVLLGFSEPEIGGSPSPLAPQPWFEQTVTSAIARLDPSRTVIALGTIGYEWVTGQPQPQAVDFATAMRLAARHKAAVALDPESLNTTFSFSDDAGREHRVWLLDAASFHNQLVVLARLKIAGVALWPVGGEDPGIWSLLRDGDTPPANAAGLLKAVSLADVVEYEGTGEFLRVIGTPVPGTRWFDRDSRTGLLTSETYEELPQGYTIGRWGSHPAKDVSLTFDDGPDPKYTPQILDILKAAKIPATFFVVGDSALNHPDILQRMVAEGHAVGNHTYAHSNISMISEPALRLGLNATQRVIIASTGRKSALFRAPYSEDTEPTVGSEAEPITLISELGYLTVGAEIDPADWSRPGSGAIVSAVIDQIESNGGNVIVLHDAGGDRSQTVAALPGIVDALRSRGYKFVSLADLLGKTRDQLMPPEQGLNVAIDVTLARSASFIREAINVIFAIALALGVLRTGVMMILAFRRKRHAAAASFSPPVTVIVPAYCEESVIVESVTSLLSCDYADLQVLVVDDGSTDSTYNVVRRVYGEHPRVRVVTQHNQGKAEALNHGYRIATTPFVVAIDADTRLARDAIGLLVRHFEDPRVGAVAGNVKVVNRRNLLARMQAIEYITGQNLERRALEVVGAITVVPGAIGAWRKEAVLAAGGLSLETLAEDADLTFAVQRTGYRVVYEEDAMALTQAPQTVPQFLRQRFRWIFGMLQTAWKHRRAIRERHPLGLFGVANILLFGTLLPLLAPIVDLVLVWSLLRFLIERVHHPLAEVDRVWLYGMGLAAIYMASDLVLAIVAFALEPREKKSLLWWVVAQRFFYRQLLYVIVFRATFFALTGRLAGWRKMSRISTAVPDTVIRADARVIELTREEPNRRRWDRRAIDLNWGGPQQRAQIPVGRRNSETRLR